MNAPVSQGGSAPTMEIKMNATQERILNLLGSGYPPSIVSSSVGVSESYISQLMSLAWFAGLVQEMKFLNLKKHTEMDDKYDDLEDNLLDRLKKASSLVVKPMELAKLLQVVNGAKRRGAGTSDVGHTTQNIVNLTIPAALAHKFISNTQNQIVEVLDGTDQSKSLVTTTSGSLERLSREVRETRETEESIRRSIREERLLPSDGASQTISSQELSALSDARTLKARLDESRRSSGQIKAEDL